LALLFEFSNPVFGLHPKLLLDAPLGLAAVYCHPFGLPTFIFSLSSFYHAPLAFPVFGFVDTGLHPVLLIAAPVELVFSIDRFQRRFNPRILPQRGTIISPGRRPGLTSKKGSSPKGAQENS
jgi:hypothetical protein